jgi:hypothetical protein
MDENIKKNLLYTNSRLLNDIAMKIDSSDIDYPKTFNNLISDENTNTILTAK